MALPEKLLHSLKSVKGFDESAFKEVHTNPEQITSIRVNPLKLFWGSEKPTEDKQNNTPTFNFKGHVPWSSFGFYLAERPSFTFDPLFHAGCYYVQEATSMFLEQALKQTVSFSKKIKDLD